MDTTTTLQGQKEGEKDIIEGKDKWEDGKMYCDGDTLNVHVIKIDGDR